MSRCGSRQGDGRAKLALVKPQANEPCADPNRKGEHVEQRMRVLIADDSSRSRDGLKALLATSPEIEVVGEATNGRETVQLVGERRPDVVLMDARMPVMDGLETTGLIKGRWPQVKVIVLTMYASHRAAALAAGADAFLIKGCPAEELLGAILDR